ncbi:SprT family zinc-dependent metalloprotease [Novosphingobium sp. EMRT-2]|uniref:SprT family zinc-dependent metalloprotease n=1 Tax=Novosphingobium sp. EMRT-2 TaxID=2571749 RepID=UPI0010BDCF7A|nr:SprT family zinc-dependent metalloprotease [Novosphingobium sp. EMRT-2]QCI92584.1 SprT family zinc-dependent metalloprotease [Novosphingobium sp. EMRT-2]
MNHRVSGLPNSVRVGLQNYRLIVTDDLEQLGRTWPDKRTITIRADQPERHDAVDTVIHELIHACFFAFNLPDEDHKEETVASLGTALTTVFRDNPALLGWIVKNVKDR